MFKVVVASFLLASALVGAQDFETWFDDGTLQGWTNTDGTTSLMSNDQGFLVKDADGSSNSEGEMSIVNSNPAHFAGNFYYDGGGDPFIREILFKAENPNDFDLHVRVGFTSTNGYQVISEMPIEVPANGVVFDVIVLRFYPDGTTSNLVIINDVSGLPWAEIYPELVFLFENVTELRLFHNPNESFEGVQMEGVLRFDYIIAPGVLAINDHKPGTDLILYPNPVENRLKISSKVSLDTYKIYSVDGSLIDHGILATSIGEIDVSSLNNGMYFIELNSADRKLVKKFIKQ